VPRPASPDHNSRQALGLGRNAAKLGGSEESRCGRSGVFECHADARLLDRIRVGSAPDSWGVWFPDGPQQVPWEHPGQGRRGRLLLDRAGPVRLSAHRPDPTRLTDETHKGESAVSSATCVRWGIEVHPVSPSHSDTASQV
jgi:hypothetical protein